MKQTNIVDLTESKLEKKVEELLHMAVRGPIAKALHEGIKWGWQQGREQGLREAREKEKTG